MNKTVIEENITPAGIRAEYLQEKARIKYEIGDLEEIRLKLGLSQRRLCRLLLVDPSAWTRWLKMPEGAPPHVYKALSWLLQLQKLDPGATAPRNFDSRLDFIQSSTQTRIKELESQMATLERAFGAAASAQPVYGPAVTDHSPAIAELRGKIAMLLKKLEVRKPKAKRKFKAKPKRKKPTPKKKPAPKRKPTKKKKRRR